MPGPPSLVMILQELDLVKWEVRLRPSHSPCYPRIWTDRHWPAEEVQRTFKVRCTLLGLTVIYCLLEL